MKAHSIDDTLHSAILAAHEAGDGVQLARHYAEAANRSERAGNFDESCFFLTQAFVFALEQGLPEATEFASELRARKRL